MNAILNENDQLIFKELQVPLQNVLENVAREIIAPVFDKFAYSDMFLPWLREIKKIGASEIICKNCFLIIFPQNLLASFPFLSFLLS